MIAIYARQSIDKKDSISIESQISFCKKEFHDEEKYKVYKDKGYSGKNTSRPEFEKLMKDIKKGIITKLIVYKLDRISRSLIDFASIMDILEDKKVDFVSATEKFDTSTPVGRAMLYIVMVFAQLERETTAERIKDNYYERGEKGYFLGGTTTYGFDNGKININGQKVPVLVPTNTIKVAIDMFHMYAMSEKSLADLGRYFNDKGIKTSTGVNWDSIKINRILRNPAYVKADADIYSYYESKGVNITNDISKFTGENGCFLYGKRDRSAGKYNNVKNHKLSLGLHKGHIDSIIFLKCQYKLDANKQIKNTGKGKYTWLSGLTKCAYCGYAMTVNTYNGKKGLYKYFKCRGKTNYKVCDIDHNTHYVEEIERQVEEALFDRVKNIKFDTKNENSNSVELNQLKLQLIDIEKKIDNLVDQMESANNVVIDYINKRITKLDSEKTNLIEEMKKYTIQNEQEKNKIIEIAKKIKDWYTLDMEEKKSISNVLIKKVLISNDDIKIEWKY